jgi:hypothetical protein
MNQQYYYSEREWDRLGCGPLPDERRYPEHKPEDSVYYVYPENHTEDRTIQPYAQT